MAKMSKLTTMKQSTKEKGKKKKFKYAYFVFRDRAGDWCEWKRYRYIDESKLFVKVRKWLFWYEILPKNGLGCRLIEKS